MKNIFIYNSPEELGKKFAEYFFNYLKEQLLHKEKYTIALSGGNTPVYFFKAAAELNPEIDWNRVHIFWADERMVPPDYIESNFGSAKINWFDKVNIPQNNIHRILGELNPDEALNIYADELKFHLVKDENNFPKFDWILLGIGSDGHTASLFPDQNLLKDKDGIAGTGEHPSSKQKRITLTYNTISNAVKISFLITGRGKAETVKKIFNNENLTAAKIISENIEWHLDKEAALKIK